MGPHSWGLFRNVIHQADGLPLSKPDFRGWEIFQVFLILTQAVCTQHCQVTDWSHGRKVAGNFWTLYDIIFQKQCLFMKELSHKQNVLAGQEDKKHPGDVRNIFALYIDIQILYFFIYRYIDIFISLYIDIQIFFFFLYISFISLYIDIQIFFIYRYIDISLYLFIYRYIDIFLLHSM